MTKTTAFILDHPSLIKPLIAQTPNQKEALITFSKHLNVDTVILHGWVEKGYIVVNGSVKDSYYSNTWKVSKTNLKEYTELEVNNIYHCCGK